MAEGVPNTSASALFIKLPDKHEAPTRSLKKRRRQQDQEAIIGEYTWPAEEVKVEPNTTTDQMSINLLRALIPGLPVGLEISPAEVKMVIDSPSMLKMMQEAGRQRLQNETDKAERELQQQMNQMNLQVQLAELENKKLDSQVLIENAKAIKQKHAWHGGYYS